MFSFSLFISTSLIYFISFFLYYSLPFLCLSLFLFLCFRSLLFHSFLLFFFVSYFLFRLFKHYGTWPRDRQLLTWQSLVRCYMSCLLPFLKQDRKVQYENLVIRTVFSNRFVFRNAWVAPN